MSKTHKLSKVTHVETENLNRPIYNLKDWLSIQKPLPTKKSQKPNGFTDKLYQTLKEDLTPTFVKWF